MIVTSRPFSVDYVPHKHIRCAAEELLLSYQNATGLDVAPPIPVEKILERHLKLTLEFDQLISNDGRGEILAMTFMTSGIVTIQDSLVPENGGHLGKYRFTLAHEIGHWQLHRKYFASKHEQETLLQPLQQPDIVCRSSGGRERAEIQADQFATELLMPSATVVRLIQGQFPETVIPSEAMETMVAAFEVSRQAARIRLKEIGLINADHRQIRMTF